jgi:hypothetical protein
MRILAGSMEYEVEFARTLLFRMHGDCYQLWQDEHRSVQPPEISGGSAASPWTLIFHDGIARRAVAEVSAYRDLMRATADIRSASLMLRRRSRAVRAETAAFLALSARLPLHVRAVVEE